MDLNKKKVIAVVGITAITFSTVGCTKPSVYEIGDMFGTGTTTATTEDDGVDTQSNKEVWLLGDWNVKEASLDEADSIPPYDFSGPSNLGTNSSNQQVAVSSTNTAQGNIDNTVVYLATFNDKDEVNRLECVDDSSNNEVIKKIASLFKSNGETEEKVKQDLDAWEKRLYKAVVEGNTTGEYMAELNKEFTKSKYTSMLTLASPSGTKRKSNNNDYWDYELEYAVCKRLQAALVSEGYQVVVSKSSRTDVDDNANTHKRKAIRATEENAALAIEIDVSGDRNIKSVSITGSGTSSDKLGEAIAQELASVGWTLEGGTPSAAVSGSTFGGSRSPFRGWFNNESYIVQLGGIWNDKQFETLTTNSGLEDTVNAMVTAIKQELPLN